jgi:hypothetical protein
VKEFKAHGDKGDVWLPNSHQWTNREAAQIFETAVVADVDRVIVTPGAGDRPLWMHSQGGKLIGQFKSFAFAASNRVLLSGLQQRDMAALNGLFMSVALGGVAYGLREYSAGRQVSRKPEKLIVESIDRSGVTGFLFDVNNIIEKSTRGSIGVSALTGGGTMSRYTSRGLLGSLLGPTADLIDDSARVTGALTSGDINDADVRAMRKLIPYQNLFYIRRMLNELEEETAEVVTNN